MNSVVKRNIISEIFHRISENMSLCVKCFSKEIHCGAFNEQEMLIHIYYNHRGFWNSSIFLPNSISDLVWENLFEYDAQSNAKCKHCNVVFYSARSRVLHHHIKMNHSIILLAFTLAKKL